MHGRGGHLGQSRPPQHPPTPPEQLPEPSSMLPDLPQPCSVAPAVSKHGWTKSVSQTVRKPGARDIILCQLAHTLGRGVFSDTPGDGDPRPCPIFVSPGRQADMNPQARETKKPTKDKGVGWVPGVPGCVSGGPEGGVRGVGGMEGSDLAPAPGAMEHYMRA